MVNPRWQVITKMKAAKFIEKIGAGWIFLSVADAVETSLRLKMNGLYTCWILDLSNIIDPECDRVLKNESSMNYCNNITHGVVYVDISIMCVHIFVYRSWHKNSKEKYISMVELFLFKVGGWRSWFDTHFSISS